MENNEFWEKKEREIQEKIIHKCMVQYLGGYNNVSGPLWSLFFNTKQAIYLMIFPEKNLLLSIFWPEKNSEKQSLDIRIPWNDITKIIFPDEKSKIKKLFFRSNNPVKVNYFLNQKNLSIRLNFSDSIDVLKNYIVTTNKELL